MPYVYDQPGMLSQVVDRALLEGQHMHVATQEGERCAGGDGHPDYREEWRP
jgi:hypothetical protein